MTAAVAFLLGTCAFDSPQLGLVAAFGVWAFRLFSRAALIRKGWAQ